MKLKEVYECFKTDQEFIGAVNSALKEIAEKNPEFVYKPKTSKMDGCHYDRKSVDGPECSGCLFGQAFQMLGWSDQFEKESDYSIIELCGYCKVPSQKNWTNVQLTQDTGNSFSEAVKILNEAE